MRHILVLIAVCGFLIGCSPTWFQDFKDDPSRQTDNVLNSVASIEQVSIVVFNQLKPLIPSARQGEFQRKFDGSIVVLNKTMGAVRTAVKVAAEAQNKNPDFTAVIADVMTAVNEVRGIITEIRDLVKSPSMSAAMNATTDAPAALPAPVLTADPVGYTELGEMIESTK